MMHWHVAQTVRNREIPASLSVIRLGFEAYVPILHKRRKVGRKFAIVPSPRFGTYIFVRFDRDNSIWGDLCREDAGHRKYFERILCDCTGRPALVPDIAMQAIRAYQPPIPQEIQMPHNYRPGERVICSIAGMRREAVFVEYCGTRPFIKTWIFGAERTTEVSTAELEPLELDN